MMKASLIVAINPNTARNAEHVAISMLTGGGKGIAINNLGIIDKKHPVLIFDPHGEYEKIAGRKVYRYRTRMNFCKQFRKAWASSKPFALAYHPKVSGNTDKERKKSLTDAAHWFGRLAWAASDGDRILYTIFEEFGEYTQGSGDEDSIIGQIWTGGRKFGIRAVAIFQRAANVSKKIWENSPNKVIGVQGGKRDQERACAEIGCTVDNVIDLGYRNKALEMYARSLDENVRTKVHYLFSKSAGTFEKVACYVPQSNYLTKNWSAKQREIDKSGGYRIAS